MPHLRIETNVPEAKIPADLAPRLCQIVADTIERPLEWCVATVIGGVNISWGGSSEPCAQASLTSIGKQGVEENKKHSKAIFDAVTKALGISSDRMYLHFIDAPSSSVGYQGRTFKDILG